MVSFDTVLILFLSKVIHKKRKKLWTKSIKKYRKCFINKEKALYYKTFLISYGSDGGGRTHDLSGMNRSL